MDTVARIALLFLMAIAAFYLSCRSKKYHTLCNLIFLLISVFVTVFFESVTAQILLGVSVFLVLYACEKLLIFHTENESRSKEVKKKTVS